MLKPRAVLALTHEELDDLDSALADTEYVARESLEKDPIYKAETEAYLERIGVLRTRVWNTMRDFANAKTFSDSVAARFEDDPRRACGRRRFEEGE